MPLNDILLQIDTYPDATADAAIDQAVGFAAAVGGRLSALAVEVDIPDVSNRVADYLIGLSKLAREEEARSRAACRAGLDRFKAAAETAGVFGEAVAARRQLYAVGDEVAVRARSRDLCLVPFGALLDSQRSVAETAVFDSGRPVLIFRPGHADLPTKEIGAVVVAWDGSRAAARAVADALPVLARAREVRVLTVLHEKPSAQAGCAKDLVRHLAAHGVMASRDEVDADRRPVGEVIRDHVTASRADLVVMGAYGRSRLREFILGGATEHVLHDPRFAVLMSH